MMLTTSGLERTADEALEFVVCRKPLKGTTERLLASLDFVP